MGWLSVEIAMSLCFASASFAVLAIAALCWDTFAEPERESLTTDLEP